MQAGALYAVGKSLDDFHTMSFSYVEMKMSLTIVEIWFSFSAGFSCYEVYFLILQWFLNDTNATFKKTIHMPL